MKNINNYDECENCKKEFPINELEICDKCNKIICLKCHTKLARTTDEINFEYHYLCYDKNKKNDRPGVFVKLYNGKISDL